MPEFFECHLDLSYFSNLLQHKWKNMCRTSVRGLVSNFPTKNFRELLLVKRYQKQECRVASQRMGLLSQRMSNTESMARNVIVVVIVPVVPRNMLHKMEKLTVDLAHHNVPERNTLHENNIQNTST